MAKRGNPGYGKMKQLEANMDKFEPLFWQLMEEFAKSKSKEDKRFFIQEFNKIQTKMIPTELGGINGEPIQVTWLQSPTPQENGPKRSTPLVHAG
jgi:hypothetical protein